jgi:hypothetical protein
VEEHHRFLLKLQLDQLQAVEEDLAILEQRIQDKLKPYADRWRKNTASRGLRNHPYESFITFLDKLYATCCVICSAISAEVLAMDAWMVLGTIVFFIVAIAYTHACDKLR